MIYFSTDFPAERLTAALAADHNIRTAAVGPKRVRLVTHLDVDSEDVSRAGEAIQQVCARLATR